MSEGEASADSVAGNATSKMDVTDGVTKLAGRLAAGGAALTAIFAFLGVTTGELNRMLRNRPTLALAMFALVGAGIAIGILVLAAGRHLTRGQVVTALISGTILGTALFITLTERDVPPTTEWVRWSIVAAAAIGLLIGVRRALTGQGMALSIGVLAFLAGLAGLTYLVVEGKAAKDRPRIEASLSRADTGWIVTAKVAAQGLTSSEHILVRIDGLSVRDPFEGRRAGRWQDAIGASRVINNLPEGNDFYQTVQLSRMGPDSDGKVDVTVTVPISTGLYERVRVSALLETEEVREALNRVSMLEDAVYRASLDAEEARKTNATHAEQDRLAAEQQKHAEALDAYRASSSHLLDRSPNCDERSADRSCTVLLFPQISVRPTVLLVPEADDANMASMHLEATEVNPDDVVEVHVGSELTTLYHAYVSVGSTGVVDLTVPVRVGELPETICAVARILETPNFAVGPGADGKTVPLPSPAPLGSACPISSHGWEYGVAELHLPQTAPDLAVDATTTSAAAPVQENSPAPAEEQTADGDCAPAAFVPSRVEIMGASSERRCRAIHESTPYT